MTNQEIKTVGQTIAQETQIGGNTAARVGGVVEGIGVALDNKDAANGYYQATINGGTITVNAPNYLLGTGGNLRIKMPSAGTTASTLTIGNANAVQLWYNGAAVSSDNTWEAEEIISVFYDGTRFMASNSQGGGGDAEKIKYNNSQSGLASDNVQGALDELVEDASYYDALDLSNATYPSNIINSNNVWARVSGASSILIPVTPGERIHVVGNGNATGTIYAMLRTNSTSGTPTWATGYAGRITRGSDEVFTLLVPSDAHYLWFMFKNSQYSLMPNVYKVGHVSDLNNGKVLEKTYSVDTWKFDITSANSRRAYDYTLYYIEEGTTFTVPGGMMVGYQTFAEDGAYGSEQTFSGWLTGTYTFPQDGWYRFIAKNSSDTNITSSQIALLNAMECVRRTKGYPETRFKLFRMDRLTGKLVVYNHNTWIAPQSTTQTLNDRFFELDGKPLSMSGNSDFFLIFFDSQYKRVADTITTLGEWGKNYISNYDYSSLGAKYVRVVAQKGNDYQNVYAIFTSGVKNNTYTSADVTVSVNSNTEIVADAADATGAIQQALFLAYLRGGKAILYEDDYILNSTTPWIDENSAPKCCLWVPRFIDTQSQYSNEVQFFTLEGTKQPVSYNYGVRLILGESVYNAVTDSSPLSVIRSEYQQTLDVISADGGVAAIALKNMNVILPNNQKAITAIDLHFTHACNIENVNTMAGYSTLNWGHLNPPPIANPNCIGIRGLIGSNWSVLNTFTNIEAFGYYVGIDLTGDHISARNISVKYNYYGINFGVLLYKGAEYHPIVVINLLDEHSVCLPQFGNNGGVKRNSVYIFGYNLMWPSQATQGDISGTDARHHKAVEIGGTNRWGGEIHYTNANDQSDGSIAGINIQDFAFFEQGGDNIKCVNASNYLRASESGIAQMEPNLLQKVWNTTRNCECIFDGTNWKNAIGEVVYEYPTYSLHGTVTSGGSPVSGATVKYTYRGVDYTTTTGNDGSYSLTVPKWTGVIEVSKSGYTTFSRRIKMTANTTLNVTLT